jgi:hypothetical protein
MELQMSDRLGHRNVWLFIGAIPTMTVVAIALFAPLDVLDRVSLLGRLLDLLRGYIPSLGAYVALSAHSQVSAAFFVLSWLFLPLQATVWLFVLYRYGDFRLFANGDAKHGRAKVTLASGVLATCIFVVLFWFPKEWSIAESWGMNNSRLGLAFFGAGGFLFVATGFSFFVISVINLLRGR